MTIYDPSGVVVYEAPITTSATIKRQLMGDYYIELVFDAVDRIDVGRGCYILYNNHRFEIMSNVIPDDTNQGGLRYTLRFEAQQSQMKRCKVFWREGENLEVSFALTSDISTFGQLVIDNVNAFLGGSTFTLGSVPSNTEMKAISFAGDSCWDAVATIAETFGVEWWAEEDGDNVRLCFGKLETGDSVEFRKGDIVSSIPSKKGDDASYGTRFYVFGSTKNLPTDYGTTVDGGVTNNVVEKRLHLPNGQQYIDAWPNLAPEDVVEQVVFFDDVMPTNVETITDIHEAVEEVIPGTSNRVYYAICADSPFGYENIIEGEQIQANFTSGDLIGQTFDLEIDTTAESFNKTFRIVPKVTDKDALEVIPNANMRPIVGDSFILVGVELPQARVEQAENELLAVGTEYAQKNSNDTEIYDCPTNAVYCHRNDCNYALGQRVTLVDEKFGDAGRQSRIQGYEKKLYDEYQAIYTVGDNSPYSRLASLEKAIQRASYGDRVGLEANIIRSKADSTIPSDYNVYSALASEEIFLSKRKGGKVKGHTDFDKGISMYGIPWEYDVERDAWTIKGNVIITKGLATYSSLKEDDVLSVFDGLPIDGTTIYWSVDADGNKILKSAGGSGSGEGGGLSIEDVKGYLEGNSYIRQQDLDSAGYITEEALEGYEFATQSWVANKGYALNSELEAVSTKLNNFLEGSDTDAIINKWSELEVFLSGLTETENLATILATKFDKANFTKSNIKSTLGISDWALSATNPSYTKSEADGKYLLKAETAVDSSKLGGVAATYFARWADHIKANGASYKHLGYGYSSDGWGTTGPAIAFGVTGYIAGIQMRWSDYRLRVGYDYNSGAFGNWKSVAYTTDLDDYVPLDTAKDITAIHNFVNGVEIGGKQITYDSAKNALVLPFNVVVEGGFATYTKLTGFTNLDVMGGILVDDDTIYINSAGQLAARVVSGGGTVELTAQAIKSALGYTPYNGDENPNGYLTSVALDGYATQDWVSDQGFLTEHQSLDGYATQKWVEDKKYLTKVAWADISDRPTKLSQFTNDSKFVTPTGAVAAIRDPEYNTYATRRTTANVNFGADAGLHYFLATSAITDESAIEGHILHFEWDNQVGRYLAQLSISHFGEYAGIRRRYTGSTADSWSEWIDILDTATYTKWAMSLTTAQKVSAVHDFTNGVKLFGKSPFSYNATKDTWELNGNLIITKGLATYTRLEGFEDLGIMAAIEVDGTTISKDGGVLHFVGNVSSGVDEGAVNTLISKALVGYATESWVTGKGYALQSSLTAVDNRLKSVETFFATDDNDTLINKWDEIVTFLNAVEGDTLDSFLSTKFDKANFTKSNIKSTLGISDWALAASKPSYAWSEITTKPSYIFYSKNAIINPTDTTFRNTSGYAYSTDGGGTTGVWASFYSNNYLAQMQFNYASATPYVRVYDYSSSAWSDWKRIAFHSTFDNYLALAGGTMKGTLISQAVRPSANGSYSLGTSSYRYSTMYGQTLDLGGATLIYNSTKKSWQLEGNLIVTGGLATYSTLNDEDVISVFDELPIDNDTLQWQETENGRVLVAIGGNSSPTLYNLSFQAGAFSTTTYDPDGAAQTVNIPTLTTHISEGTKLYFTEARARSAVFSSSSVLTASRALISNSSGKVAVSAVTSTELGYLDGVTSAIQTQLNNKQATLVSGTNIKTINGTSILGSGNITISGGGSGDYLPIDGGTLTGRLFLASSATQGFSLAQLVLGPNQYARISSNDSGNFYIYGRQITLRPSSTTSASSLGAVIDTAGNMNVTGAVTENSDRKLKDMEYEGDGLDLDVLKKVRVAKWKWKDKRDKRLHIGGVADNLAEVMPEVVFESQEEDGTTTSSIAYGKAGFSIAASLIAPVVRHEDRIKELEKNIEKMQKELNKLKKSA